jgi:REP element-mobilizing transposase RayT
MNPPAPARPGQAFALRLVVGAMSRPRRLQSFSYIGRAQYSLTFCTFDRCRAFVDRDTFDRTMSHIRRAATNERFSLLVYCLMPDHAHLLVGGIDEPSDLRKFAKSAKQRSAHAHARAKRERLWQKGYFDRILRPTEDPKCVARYILENPVRAKLVASPRDYPFLGSDVWDIDTLIGPES